MRVEAPQVQDGVRLRSIMAGVVAALAPCLVIGLYNTGYQANRALGSLLGAGDPGWRIDLLQTLGIPASPEAVWACAVHGLLWFAPLWAVALLVGRAWEIAFAAGRGRPQQHGLVVIATLFALSVPARLPLWQAALGASFAFVVGRELFGGTGRNVVNPAAAGLAFLYLAYPEATTGDAVWVPVDGVSGATPLAAAQQGLAGLREAGVGWLDSFWGRLPGAIGDTSTAGCALGALVLLHLRLASWRILAGGLVGLIVASLAFQNLGSGLGPVAVLPWYWHLTLGSFAFGLVFLLTDPVTSSATNAGRWVYGALFGVLVVTIRVANPNHREGVLFAVLMANLAAPLIDHVVVLLHAWRRERRLA